MAFMMQDGWKEEPVSITGADYVEPSAEIPLRSGQRVAHLFPRSVMEEYVLQRMTDRTYWVTRHFYGSVFYVGRNGVLLLDPFLGGAESLLTAIASVMPLPVTAICYSHFHADHIGGARKLIRALDKPPRVIASEHTADLEFDWFCDGHGNIGEKSDFDFYINYLDEVAALIEEEIPRPQAVPDLYLTDYLSDLGTEARMRLLAELDNHFSLYLYGRQIARGEKPDRGAGPGLGPGPGALMGGLVGEWTAQRQQAVREATPRILQRLRPKYGRMYNFDDAQPINIALLAQSMQASLTNR